MHKEQPEKMSTELIPEDPDDPSSPGFKTAQNTILTPEEESETQDGLWSMLLGLVKGKPDATLRETLEDAIEDGDVVNHADEITVHEKMLLSNVLKLKDQDATDVMVPRADITAIDVTSSHKELLALLAETQFSRLPVYQDTLDNMLGSIHIKDIMAELAKGKEIDIRSLLREIPVVSPSMPVLDLMLHMQQTHKHMAFVVDEFGGIDGIVTIGEVLESIVGEIDDEYDQNNSPQMNIENSGDIVADARIDIDEFEKQVGLVLNQDEREESETLGGLILYMAGRVPARGEVLPHHSGMVFEILDADPRKINQLRIKNIPSHA